MSSPLSLYRRIFRAVYTIPKLELVDIVDFSNLLPFIRKIFSKGLFPQPNDHTSCFILDGLYSLHIYQKNYHLIEKILGDSKDTVIKDIIPLRTDPKAFDSFLFPNTIQDHSLYSSIEFSDYNLCLQLQQLYLVATSLCSGFGNRAYIEKSLNAFVHSSRNYSHMLTHSANSIQYSFEN